jgi:hypothetical protein
VDGSLLGEVVRGILPTIGVSLLFGAAIWAIVRADASERAERARIEAEEDAAALRAAGGTGAVPAPARREVAEEDRPGTPGA